MVLFVSENAGGLDHLQDLQEEHHLQEAAAAAGVEAAGGRRQRSAAGRLELEHGELRLRRRGRVHELPAGRRSERAPAASLQQSDEHPERRRRRLLQGERSQPPAVSGAVVQLPTSAGNRAEAAAELAGDDHCVPSERSETGRERLLQRRVPGRDCQVHGGQRSSSISRL